MFCKNCERQLRTDFRFCPDCGAKIIRNRITLKNLWGDVVERVFNIDNTFLKTFGHLFSKPEVVIEGYIEGTRVRYINPISYLAIAITLSGFLIVILKNNVGAIDFDVFGTGSSSIAQQKLASFTFDYQALLFVLYIPIMAIAGWLSFPEKTYNFSERLVIFMYTLAHYSISIFFPSMLILLLSIENYGSFSIIGIIIMYAYSAYVIKRISREKGIGLFARILLFTTLFTIMYFAISAMIPLMMILMGKLSLADFKPN